jgi:hypothetical protein
MIQLDDIKQLVSEMDERVLSIYLTVDPAARENQATTPAWRITLKNMLRDIESGLDRNYSADWEAARQRLDAYFRDYSPASKGLALFFTLDWQQEYSLPIPVENQAAFGRPLVAPLLWAIDEYEPYLIVLVDSEKAHFLTAYLGTAEVGETIKLELETEDWREKTLMPATSHGRNLNQGSHRDIFEDRVQEHTERFYRDVVDHMQELLDEHPARRILLGGHELAAHAVRDLLPERMAETVVDVMAIPMRSSAHEVLAHVLPRALEYEREQELALVDQVINLAKAGGRGALGREAVMQALEQQRVELLLAPWPLDDSLNDLPARVFASGGSIELVHGEAAERLKAEGGLGARLYYAL